MNIDAICDIILDVSSSPEELRFALDAFTQQCSEVSDIQPDPSFDAWAEDSLLASGVAINPNAAAHCALDYQRSVVFIRGVYAAIKALKLRLPETPLEILYAGCGPFATLLLPLLGKFQQGALEINLLDIHQRSLDSVELLLTHFGFSGHAVHTIKDDACQYKHPGNLHLIIAEVMQKSLEQEPQFAVTANLAPQLCAAGVFIPQRIEVALYIADLHYEKELMMQSHKIDSKALEKSGRRYPLATVCTLLPEQASFDVEPTVVSIPAMANITRFDAALFTRLCVFEEHRLLDYECQITLPLKCYELEPLVSGDRFRVSYQLGGYPRFNFERLRN